jgi:hypothetical protein
MSYSTKPHTLRWGEEASNTCFSGDMARPALEGRTQPVAQIKNIRIRVAALISLADSDADF